MNENINLIEILKDCPKGTKLYSPLYGIVEFQHVQGLESYPIVISYNGGCYFFTKEGKYINNEHGECILFPSKDQRDWSKFKCSKLKFDPKTLKPFDKVLVQEWGKWTIDFFSYFNLVSENPYYCIGHFADIIIPYNDNTKHLVGTNEEVPEYYRYWED